MSDITFEEVVSLAQQLSPAERVALIERLRSTLQMPDEHVTREMLLAEHTRLLEAGAFDNVESLRNKYARPDLSLSFEELEAGINEFANQWQADIDDLYKED